MGDYKTVEEEEYIHHCVLSQKAAYDWILDHEVSNTVTYVKQGSCKPFTDEQSSK